MGRAIVLSQEIRELKNRIEALHNNPNHIDAKAELEKIPGQRERLQHTMKVLNSMLEHPDRLMPRWDPARALYSLLIPNAEGERWDDIEAETILEVRSKLATRAAHNLGQLTDKLAALTQEEAKAKALVGGFMSQIQALTARRELLESDLLRESRVAEQAG